MLQKIYFRLPEFAQSLGLSIFGIKIRLERYGADLKKASAELGIATSLSEAELVQLQFKKLKNLLIHANDIVPYWNQVFRECNFFPERIKTAKELKKLPILKKGDIIKNFDRMQSVRQGKGIVVEHTGGITGTPLVIKTTKKSLGYEYANYKESLRQ